MPATPTPEISNTAPSTNGHLDGQQSPPPQEILFQASLGYIISACVSVAAKLNLADLIGDGEREVVSLAEQACVSADYLFRVLRVLEMAHIVTRKGPRTFSLTPAGELLRRGVPGTLAAFAELLTDPLQFRVFSELLGSVKAGATIFDELHGQPFFAWLSRPENQQMAALFNDAMTSFSATCAPAFLEAYDFGSFTRIMDVGGGHGAILRAILKEYPDLSGTIAEIPSVVPNARTAIEAEGMAHRCDAAECDFFAGVPAGGDAYFMKGIIHDWPDDLAIQLLRNIRTVIPPHGKLLLAESVLDDSPAPHPAKLLDIEMMAFVGGKERTEEEFRQLLADAGFALKQLIPTRSPVSLLEAVPC